MSHTPGPWTVRAGAAGAGRVQIVSPSHRKECDAEHVICELRPWQRPDYGPDARLIAAAPELLAQLKMAADFISGHNECLSEPSGSGDREWNAYCIGLLDDCKSAIAKAEGRVE